MNITLNLPIDAVNYVLSALLKAHLPKESTDQVFDLVSKQAQAHVDELNAKIEEEKAKAAE